MPKTQILYFAFGSNMKTSRLQARTPSANPVGIAKLKDYKLEISKYSRSDGSGKGNIIESKSDEVWGVLFKLNESELSNLDRAEAGYDRVLKTVIDSEGKEHEALLYQSDKYTDEPAFEWYKKYIVDGAKEHNLPEGYIKYLEKLPSKGDNA
ncbi:gamma-glutamylcyclotransferase family protein [Natranaerofaba carboxydovora]|uniref:gamma-glutamylcyclotransferase family protein n=1 Tax=Natranaerofaba carboxydovora TaxID=2742683 RepID=UPI001F1423C9|nr:gamma-glutamylcyclotransferase family protein [Natranaerofaba carboxydovora]UMZ74359.1 AIG2-like family protein [Natranaerofaba carboxydovora]